MPLTEEVALGVVLPLSELLPEVEALTPSVREGVGEGESVEEPLRVEEGVGGGVPVRD